MDALPPPPSEILYPPLSVDIDQVPKPLKITFSASSGPPLFNGYYCVEKNQFKYFLNEAAEHVTDKTFSLQLTSVTSHKTKLTREMSGIWEQSQIILPPDTQWVSCYKIFIHLYLFDRVRVRCCVAPASWTRTSWWRSWSTPCEEADEELYNETQPEEKKSYWSSFPEYWIGYKNLNWISSYIFKGDDGCCPSSLLAKTALRS